MTGATKVELVGGDGRWTITLRVPDRRNSVGDVMRRQMRDVISTVSADPFARTLLALGDGAAFCASTYLPTTFDDFSRTVTQARTHLDEVCNNFLQLRAMSIPTIAAVQGPAIGAGLNLAMACDVRIAALCASFAATFDKIGLHPGGGGTWSLVNVLGSEKALAMLPDGGATVAVGPPQFTDDPPRVRASLPEPGRRSPRSLPMTSRRRTGWYTGGDFAGTLEFESWAQASSATKPAIQQFVTKFRR
jgi:enoyl-CoA hydratase